jgi:hypothetical protein
VKCWDIGDVVEHAISSLAQYCLVIILIYFDSLLHACESFAREQQICRLIAGVNTARHDAYQMMMSLGFRTEDQGVVMDNPNKFCYNKPDIYLIDDWR